MTTKFSFDSAELRGNKKGSKRRLQNNCQKNYLNVIKVLGKTSPSPYLQRYLCSFHVSRCLPQLSMAYSLRCSLPCHSYLSSESNNMEISPSDSPKKGQNVTTKFHFFPSSPREGTWNWAVFSRPCHATLGREWSRGKQKHYEIFYHFGVAFSWLAVCLVAADLWLVSRASPKQF